MTDPRIQQLAAETAQKIRSVASDRDNQIRQIYEHYREKAASIRAEASVDSLSHSDTDQSPEPHPQHRTH